MSESGSTPVRQNFSVASPTLRVPVHGAARSESDPYEPPCVLAAMERFLQVGSRTLVIHSREQLLRESTAVCGPTMFLVVAFVQLCFTKA